jgi:hypothetical protein
MMLLSMEMPVLVDRNWDWDWDWGIYGAIEKIGGVK